MHHSDPARHAITAALVVLAPGAVAAHHSFAVFDHTQTVTVSGTVAKFQWTNPHGFLEVDYRAGARGRGHRSAYAAACSSAPLKPQFLKEWQARQQAAREDNREYIDEKGLQRIRLGTQNPR